MTWLDDLSRDYLVDNLEGDRMIPVGDRLYFSPDYIGHLIQALLETQEGRLAVSYFQLTKCNQRVSVNIGQSDNSGLGEVFLVNVSGRLLGCDFEGDWWVRAKSMFGSQESMVLAEAEIKEDGTFESVGGFPGVRFIFVFGKGADIVGATAVNLTVGADNHIPPYDVSANCP